MILVKISLFDQSLKSIMLEEIVSKVVMVWRYCLEMERRQILVMCESLYHSAKTVAECRSKYSRTSLTALTTARGVMVAPVN